MASELNATSLVHENIVQVFDVFEASKDDTPTHEKEDESKATLSNLKANTVIIMEYVGKANLLTLIEQHSEKVTEEFVQK